MVQKLSELISRQQYEIKIQAVVKEKILASGTIKPVRKDTKLNAHNISIDLYRQKKLLKHQAEGKKTNENGWKGSIISRCLSKALILTSAVFTIFIWFLQ